MKDKQIQQAITYQLQITAKYFFFHMLVVSNRVQEDTHKGYSFDQIFKRQQIEMGNL